jgi:hypothetical protein
MLRLNRSASVLRTIASFCVSLTVQDWEPFALVLFYSREGKTAETTALIALLLHFRTTYSGRNHYQLPAKENCADIVFACNAQIC